MDAGRLLTRLVDPVRGGDDSSRRRILDRGGGGLLRRRPGRGREADEQRRARVHSSTWRQGDPARDRAGAEAHPYDIVVLGSGPTGGWTVWSWSSVSNHVLTHSITPVLVVHQAPDGDGRVRVLAGADGSPAFELAIETLTSVSQPAMVDVTRASGGRDAGPGLLGPTGSRGADHLCRGRLPGSPAPRVDLISRKHSRGSGQRGSGPRGRSEKDSRGSISWSWRRIAARTWWWWALTTRASSSAWRWARSAPVARHAPATLVAGWIAHPWST